MSSRRVALMLAVAAAALAMRPAGAAQDEASTAANPFLGPEADRAQAEFNSMVAVARKDGFLALKGSPKPEVQANLVGFRSGNILFSRRLDSQTYFAQDALYSIANSAGAFQGSDQELQDRARSVLEKMGVPSAEVQKLSVLKVMGQAARRDPVSQQLSLEPAQMMNRRVLVTRQIGDIPVFSSRVMMGLTRKKQVGFMELHWPKVGAETLAEARQLAALVKGGWPAPEKEGARIESVEAGIIHSAALGFVMDVHPVIRVIYAPLQAKIGKKPVAYYDRNGNEVPAPREFAHAREEAPVSR